MDSIWLISRLTLAHSLHPTSADPHCQTVPSWTAFSAKLNKENIPLPSNVGYCQAIDASATEMSTIYTALCKSIRMGEQLGQEDIVIVFDLAIYAKAVEIIWKRQEEMNKVVIRMGAFHITCTLLAVIGKRFGDVGLANLMTESGIIGMGSVNGVLNGKQYNRAVRMNKILYEAFWSIRWESFCKWLENSRQVVDVDHITHVIHNFKDSISNGSLEILLEDPVISHLYQLEENFRDMDKGPMAEFWNSFLDIVSLLLCFIRSIRLGNWDLHLFCIREMLPWIHIYDRVNYACYLPYY